MRARGIRRAAGDPYSNGLGKLKGEVIPRGSGRLSVCGARVVLVRALAIGMGVPGA